jgi:hypothetical protein
MSRSVRNDRRVGSFGPVGGLGAVIFCDGTVEYVATKFGILLGSRGTAVRTGRATTKPGVEGDMADDTSGGDKRPDDTDLLAKGAFMGDRGIGCEGMKSVPSPPLTALMSVVRLPLDGARLRRGIAPVGAVLGRKEGVFNLGNRITARPAICACKDSEVLVGGEFLNAVAFAGELFGGRKGFIDKGAEDSSLVAVLSKDCVEDHAADPTGFWGVIGMG